MDYLILLIPASFLVLLLWMVLRQRAVDREYAAAMETLDNAIKQSLADLARSASASNTKK